jgi:hypothetical protein
MKKWRINMIFDVSDYAGMQPYCSVTFIIEMVGEEVVASTGPMPSNVVDEILFVYDRLKEYVGGDANVEVEGLTRALDYPEVVNALRPYFGYNITRLILTSGATILSIEDEDDKDFHECDF